MTNNMSKLDVNQSSIRDALTSAMDENTRYSGPPSTPDITANKRGSPNDLEEENKGEMREIENQEPPRPPTVSSTKETTAIATGVIDPEDLVEDKAADSLEDDMHM